MGPGGTTTNMALMQRARRLTRLPGASLVNSPDHLPSDEDVDRFVASRARNLPGAINQDRRPGLSNLLLMSFTALLGAAVVGFVLLFREVGAQVWLLPLAAGLGSLFTFGFLRLETWNERVAVPGSRIIPDFQLVAHEGELAILCEGELMRVVPMSERVAWTHALDSLNARVHSSYARQYEIVQEQPLAALLGDALDDRHLTS